MKRIPSIYEIMLRHTNNNARAGSSALRALAVLELVVRARSPLTLEEVTSSCGLPKPTAFRILGMLSEAGFLQRDPINRRYSVGSRLSSLALEIVISSPEHAQRHAILQRLVDEIGETINFTMLDGASAVYVDRVETAAPIRLHMEVGSRVPLHCTASGKMFLSAMSREQVHRILGKSRLPRYTSRTIVDLSTLERQLPKIRRQGYSTDVGEFMEGSVGFAVPVLDGNGRIVATVTIHGPSPRMTVEKGKRYLSQLRQAAKAIADTFVYGREAVKNVDT